MWNVPVYYLLAKYKLPIWTLTFLEYCYMIAFDRQICTLTMMSSAWQKCANNISTLNLPIISIKFITCNNATFPVSFLNEKYFSNKYFLLFKYTIADCIENVIEHWLTHSASFHRWCSFPEAFTSYKSMVIYVNFSVICTFWGDLRSNDVWFTRCSPFWLLNSYGYLPVFWPAAVALIFPAIYFKFL